MRPTALAAAALLALGAGTAAAQQRTVHVYNWSDYIDESILADFTAETGIRVVYDVYDSNEVLETKLLAGGAGYDIVVPTGSYLARQIQAGVYQKLDKDKIPSAAGLDPQLMELVQKYDPGNEHAVIYMWGTTGFAYNVAMIEQRMPDAPVESWRMLFDPEVVARFADCGVYMLDSPEDMLPSVLSFLGEDPDSKDPAVLQRAAEVLKAVRPHIRKFHSSENINALASGEICLAAIWSGDAGIAAARAAEADSGIEIEYVAPDEGMLLWFDLMAIPADAPDPEAAHAFIDFILRPEVIARATNYVTYPNAVPASLEFVDAELRDDPNTYPPEDKLARAFTLTPYDARLQRTVTRLWQQVQTGG